MKDRLKKYVAYLLKIETKNYLFALFMGILYGVFMGWIFGEGDFAGRLKTIQSFAIMMLSVYFLMSQFIYMSHNVPLMLSFGVKRSELCICKHIAAAFNYVLYAVTFFLLTVLCGEKKTVTGTGIIFLAGILFLILSMSLIFGYAYAAFGAKGQIVVILVIIVVAICTGAFCFMKEDFRLWEILFEGTVPHLLEAGIFWMVGIILYGIGTVLSNRWLKKAEI